MEDQPNKRICSKCNREVNIGHICQVRSLYKAELTDKAHEKHVIHLDGSVYLVEAYIFTAIEHLIKENKKYKIE